LIFIKPLIQFHYSGFFPTGPEGAKVLLMDQIELSSQTKTNQEEDMNGLIQTQVTIKLNLPTNYHLNDSERSDIQVLDLKFFDNF
jgi:hypothetical protein